MATKNDNRGEKRPTRFPHCACPESGPLFGAKALGKSSGPTRSGDAVSLSEHGTVSSFLFLFWVLLAKHCDVYTSGYYICQNNYSMTNGSST